MTSEDAMSLLQSLRARLPSAPRVSLFDLLVGVVLVAGGLAFHWDFKSHSQGLIGDCPFGDAEFWWDGALRVSEAQLHNHPGRGMRPGFFALAGLSVPVLGPAPVAYHKFLLMLFLASGVLLYLALRDALGRPAALCGVALALFNPYTAQWLATTTTDGTGLVLHALALGCLLLSVARGLHRGWLAAFGFLFALGTLTRPLVTPFIGLVLACVVLLPGRPWRGRLLAAGTLLLTFCLPTFSWMAVQRVLIKQWSLSDNDASAFYGASDPKIQVWNGAMYTEVVEEARKRFGTAAPTEAQINRVFWSRTLDNYVEHARYHFDRALPHLWVVAAFAPPGAPDGMAWWQNTLLACLAAGLGLRLLSQRRWQRTAALFAAACCLGLFPQTLGLLTIGGVVIALGVRPRGWQDPASLFIALYWLCGAAALYLTGGTWGPPAFTGGISLNALGYRLGAQVFFSGGLLASYFLIQCASLYLPAVVETGAVPVDRSRPARLADRFLRIPNPLAGRLVQGAFAAVAAAVLVIYTGGTALALHHRHVRHATPRATYPNAAPVAELYRKSCTEAHGRKPPVTDDCTRLASLLSANGSGGTAGDVVAVGQVGPLLWNLDGQERALLRLQPQHFAAPRDRRGPSEFVQVPAHLALKEWAGAQGAFVLRRIPDAQNSPLAQYFSVPVVRGFVPLEAGGAGYALERAVWFPLDLYVSQLVGTGDLHCSAGELDWTQELKAGCGRRLAILPPRAAPYDLGLRFDLARMKRPTALSFGYKWAIAAAGPHVPLSELRLRVEGIRRDTGERVLLHAARETTDDAREDQELRPVRIDLGGRDDLAAVEVRWNSQTLPVPVLIYEMVLRVEELCP